MSLSYLDILILLIFPISLSLNGFMKAFDKSLLKSIQDIDEEALQWMLLS
jgi:hypothetical protein